MGHYVYTTRQEQQEDPVVRAKLDACNELKAKLEQIKESATTEYDTASTAIADCKEATEPLTEELSGVYYESRYLPYREKYFELGDSLLEECEGCLGELQDRIDKLAELIAELETKLMIWVTVTDMEWVSDDSDTYDAYAG